MHRGVVVLGVVALLGCGADGPVEFVPEPGLALPPVTVVPGLVVTVGGTLELRNGSSRARSLEVRVTPADGALRVDAVGPPMLEPGERRRVEVRASLSAVGARRWSVEVAGATAVVTAEGLAVGRCVLRPELPTPLPGRFVERVTLENVGVDSCFLTSVRVDDAPGLRVVDRPSLARPVPPGGSLEVEVAGRIAPTDAADLVVEAAGAAPVRVRLTAPCGLVWSPSTLDFGDVSVGCGSAQRALALSSTCPGEQDVSLALPANGPFTVEGPSRVRLGGLQQAHTVTVRFQPGRTARLTTSLSATFDALPRVPAAVVTVSGTGAPARVTVDRFFNQRPRPADLLVVADTGSSLRPSMDLLRAPILGFPWPRSDTHVALTIGGSDGRLVSLADGGVFLTSRSHSTLGALVDAWPESQPRAASASCLDTALLALAQPHRVGPNAGFKREGAALGLLCLSDRPDATSRSAADALSMLEAAAGGAVSVWGWGDVSGVLGQVVDASRGFSIPLGQSPWWNIGWIDQFPRKQFFLNAVPLDGELLVSVEGLLQPPVDGSGRTVWRYDPSQNAVVFEDYPFENLEIRYRVCF
jgi:hypothetical protein